MEELRNTRVLYVCPLAHLEGHPCNAAISETKSLADLGYDVTLLTFSGLINGQADRKVRHITVLKGSKSTNRRLIALNSGKFSSGLLVSIATLLTFAKAVSMKRRLHYDIMHIRDATGLFLSFPQFLGMIYKRNRWLVSLLDVEDRKSFLGGIIRSTKTPAIYNLSFSDNMYLYTCQNNALVTYYSTEFANGLLNSKVFLLPPIIERPLPSDQLRSEQEAKLHLGLKPDDVVFLSFGALHSGKDLETVLEALRSYPSIKLLHAGRTSINCIARFNELKKIYSSDQFIVNDNYVPEQAKVWYFGAASALILSYAKDFTATSSMLWEACRFQIPVIASDNDQLAELVTKYDLGVVYKAQDVKSLVGAIASFRNLQPARIAQIKENCRKFCQDFSEQAWGLTCARIYNKLQTA